MMTQKDMDAHDKLREIVEYGTVIAQHPRDTRDRWWVHTEKFSGYLYPGEFALEYAGAVYIVGIRETW